MDGKAAGGSPTNICQASIASVVYFQAELIRITMMCRHRKH